MNNLFTNKQKMKVKKSERREWRMVECFFFDQHLFSSFQNHFWFVFLKNKSKL